MPCNILQPTYIPPYKRGLRVINSEGDGYSMNIFWYRAYPSINDYSIGYNIYYSTEPGENVFEEGPKYLSTNISGLSALLKEFSPGDIYYFAVRAMQYDSAWFNPADLPSGGDGYLRIYPEAVLTADITDSSVVIPITDIGLFPDYGVIQIGAEWVRYASRDIVNSSLLGATRGFLGTEARLHTIDGYDGYIQRDPIIRFFKGLEDNNGFINQEVSSFQNYNIFTENDGYKTRDRVGILTTDLSASDADRVDFRSYDYVGWHRTNPTLLFQGKCLDTYIGGEHFCADGYEGVGRTVRNIPFSEQADRREEMLLEQTGVQVVLVQRLWDGIVCSCYEPGRENPEARCPFCLATGYIGGYQQYFNPRRSDSRILVSLNPYNEDLKVEDGGLESHVIYDAWTLTVPTVRDRDFIIRFNLDGTEEYRYEILDVTRNTLLYGESGKQNFKAQRVRKTDPIYMWRAVRNTATMPSSLATTVGLLRGANGSVIPHTHTVVINENITSISQINQTTSQNSDHSHQVVDGVVQMTLGHTHGLVL